MRLRQAMASATISQVSSSGTALNELTYVTRTTTATVIQPPPPGLSWFWTTHEGRSTIIWVHKSTSSWLTGPITISSSPTTSTETSANATYLPGIDAGPESTSTSAPTTPTRKSATQAVVISLSTTIPVLLGAFCAWFMYRRRSKKRPIMKTEDSENDECAAVETDGAVVSELSDVKDPREVEDTGISEMHVPPVELEGDAPAQVLRSDHELSEGVNWFRETVGAVLSTK
ncbi:hypothetical protein CB0940_03699 [Cercospora beticola]|uniref:Uncharacterized protein n=1 Tax=Cercospora beticola TaxID=122368 RepID=A0A2G5I306_CERBT|nr:hypothetical protein CB0940_03699 [Cercospora beticola]PIA99195.1 hypothetical protein CB0940_03699 [Cercospora beticola]WPB00881.1 hypothetical protein RHO25_005501 [Cercospora beticola]CAK1360872.1 unnamed protein product [Cercospora beticola]